MTYACFCVFFFYLCVLISLVCLKILLVCLLLSASVSITNHPISMLDFWIPLDIILNSV